MSFPLFKIIISMILSEAEHCYQHFISASLLPSAIILLPLFTYVTKMLKKKFERNLLPMKFTLLDDIREKHETHPVLIQSIAVFSFFFSFFINVPYLNIILDFKPKIRDFSKHIISDGTYNNFDISSRVKIYYLAFTSIFLITCFIFIGIFYFVRRRFSEPVENKKILIAIQHTAFIGIASVLASVFLVEVDLAGFFLLFLGIYFFCSNDKTTNAYYNNGLWILITAFPIAYLTHKIFETIDTFSFLRGRFSFYEVFIPVSGNTLSFFFFFIITAMILHLLLKVLMMTKVDDSDLSIQRLRRIYLSTVPISMIIIILSISFEICNVINLKTGLVFNSPKTLFTGLVVLGIAASIILYQSQIKKGNSKNIIFDPIEKYHFPLFILSLAFMISQPGRMYAPDNEFFEFANHGLSVDHFFRYGSIPIIETFDAHMLSYQLYAYLYGLIVGYEPWAPFLYNSYNLIFTYLLVYILLKRFIGAFSAFSLLLCFPMINVIITNYIYSGFVALTLFSLFYRKENKQFYWFWASIIFLLLYRLDLGYAAAMAGFLGYFLIHFMTQKPYHLKSFIKTGAISASATASVFVFLCFIKGVNPIYRLLEILSLVTSNQNWTFENLGDSNHVVFRITYYLLPIITLFLLFKTIWKSILFRNFFIKIAESKPQLAALLFFVFFSLFFYFNAPRGIVRHSFFFNNISMAISTIPMAFICYTHILRKKNNLIYLLCILISTFYVTNILSTTFSNKEVSYFTKAFASVSFNEKFQPLLAFPQTRVIESFSFEEIRNFKKIVNDLLLPDETYFDFSSTNYYYALVERKNPLYVNQSPLLLNGDISQDFALEQIKKAKIPLVLIPTLSNFWHRIDGIPVEYKYFKIAEHIFQNYSPFLTMSGFTIYVKNKKNDHFKKKLKKIRPEKRPILNPVSYNLGEIPMVWGELADQKLFNSVSNLSRELVQNSLFLPLDLGTQKKNSYYLFLEIESNSTQTAKVELLDEKKIKRVDYVFTANPGKHRYAIRLSSTPHWWSEIISNISLATDKSVKISKFAVISEDGKKEVSFTDSDLNIGNNANNLHLSNITDKNWLGGTSTFYNVISLDNSQQNLSALLKGNKIKLHNGSILTVTNYKVIGNFIHINIKEPLAPYISAISYPNSFEIIE